MAAEELVFSAHTLRHLPSQSFVVEILPKSKDTPPDYMTRW
ncbi:hypothetical protein [Tabrizicola sp.]|nr:hypothetical protein [Tabrizicola sp.]MDM7932728.1 hypothetical protein [Tabrizicola sp.]